MQGREHIRYPSAMQNTLALIVLLVVAFLVPPTGSESQLPYEYEERQMEGWTVLVQRELMADEDLCQRVTSVLEVKLWEIETRLPQAVVERLQSVKIRLHLDRAGCAGGVYHPSQEWLREHDFPEDWARGIEFGNARNFLSWGRQQPAMVLHELAHAWHHQVLGYERKEVIEAFEQTEREQTLDEVLYVTGGAKRAYALNNPQEFFAEMSEAWWATNDFFPFVRVEVQESFPHVVGMLESCWKMPD
ncbi:MAG: hypothetical protein ACI9F9_001297 [Candidatus Paceibacteria bacterium]|jgi:hypothetical protein